MKRSVAMALIVGGALAAQAANAWAAGGASFASGGASSGGRGSGGSHGGAISRSSSMGGGRFSARSASVARSSVSAHRFAVARNLDPYRNFSPRSVVPWSQGGFGFNSRSVNGWCFPGQFCWNGRNCFFPWRFGSRFAGNGWVGLGGSWWPSDDDTIPKHHDELDQPPTEPVMIPVPVMSVPPVAAQGPALEPAPAVHAAPVSREFAYGSVVSEVQSRLAREGYFRGSIDGYLTAGTRTAIAMFQDRHQLVITGRIDSALLQALSLKPQSDS